MSRSKNTNKYLGSGENIAVNKRARFDFDILEVFEAGLILTGSEVKSLRLGQASIAESYAAAENGDIVLINATIAEYTQAPNYAQHTTTRPRKLLLHKKEIARLVGAVQQKGLTLVPMRLYFNKRGKAKIEIGLGRGKKLHDKRQTEKNRDWKRDKSRIMKEMS